MKYDISKATAPKMPNLGNGVECIKLIASQISLDMREAIIPAIFPALSAYVSGAEFQYGDLTWKELCGSMAHLIAESGMGKGQLTACIEAIMRKFRMHDEEELQKQPNLEHHQLPSGCKDFSEYYVSTKSQIVP